MCFVTKKLVKLTKYANPELKISNHKIFESSLASAIVIPTTSSSIINATGSRNATDTGAMYIRRFIELSLSLRSHRVHFSTNQALNAKILTMLWMVLIQSTVHDDISQMFKLYGRKVWAHYASEDSKTPWSTVLSARAAVALTHIINPNRWKLGSPFIQVR